MYCLHGDCTPEQCRSDADCAGGGVCACSVGVGHLNVCVPANCHVDGDCGPGGYCSPSVGYCGQAAGFFCHSSADTCVDPAMDCGTCSTARACVYAPTVGAFACGTALCAG